MISTKTARAALVMVICAALSACTQSSLRISPDFGNAVNQDMVAQIADPDAHYEGVPAPGSSPARVGLAQKRYNANQVIQPSSTTASSKTLGTVTAGNSRLDHDFVADAYPSHECAHFTNSTCDIVSEDVREGNLDSAQAASYPDIEMIQSAGFDCDQNLIWFDGGRGYLTKLKHFGPTMLLDDYGFHSVLTF